MLSFVVGNRIWYTFFVVVFFCFIIRMLFACQNRTISRICAFFLIHLPILYAFMIPFSIASNFLLSPTLVFVQASYEFCLKRESLHELRIGIAMYRLVFWFDLKMFNHILALTLAPSMHDYSSLQNNRE